MAIASSARWPASGARSQSPRSLISRFFNFRLTNGTVYSYKVVAFNRGGNGPASNVVEATPLAPPTELTAAAGNRQVTLAWRASPGAMSYAVFRRTRTDADHFARVGGPIHDDDAGRCRSDQRHALHLSGSRADRQRRQRFLESRIRHADGATVAAAGGRARESLGDARATRRFS